MKIVNLVSSDGLEFISGFIDDIKYNKLIASDWTEVVEPAVSDVAEPSVTDAG